jgi:hypothetical protein
MYVTAFGPANGYHKSGYREYYYFQTKHPNLEEHCRRAISNLLSERTQTVGGTELGFTSCRDCLTDSVFPVPEHMMDKHNRVPCC